MRKSISRHSSLLRCRVVLGLVLMRSRESTDNQWSRFLDALVWSRSRMVEQVLCIYDANCMVAGRM